MEIAALDWVFAALLLASLLLGAWRGLVFELCSLAGWIVAFFAARAWGTALGLWLPVGEADALWRPVLGFALVFIGTVFASGLLAWGVKKLLDAVGLRPADRALGALFGLARGVLLALVLVLVGTWSGLHDQPWWQASRVAALLQDAALALLPALPAALTERLPG